MAMAARKLGSAAERFTLAANFHSVDQRANWQSTAVEWVGAAAWSERHYCMGVRSLAWRHFNVLTLGLGGRDDLSDAVAMVRARPSPAAITPPRAARSAPRCRAAPPRGTRAAPPRTVALATLPRPMLPQRTSAAAAQLEDMVELAYAFARTDPRCARYYRAAPTRPATRDASQDAAPSPHRAPPTPALLRARAKLGRFSHRRRVARPALSCHAARPRAPPSRAQLGARRALL